MAPHQTQEEKRDNVKGRNIWWRHDLLRILDDPPILDPVHIPVGRGKGVDVEFVPNRGTILKAMWQAILLFKYGGRPSIGRHLGWLMGEAADGLLDPRDFDLVLPVPFHAQRERERGGATYRVMFPA